MAGRQRSARTRTGLTLVEVAVAVALLAILLLGLFATLRASRQVGVVSHEHQAASEAAFRQLDLIMSTPLLDDVLREPGGGDVAAYAFHVRYKGTNLQPADPSYLPHNPDNPATPGLNEATMAGHVRVVELDADGDSAPDDYDGDGKADYLEVQVVVAWRSAGGGSTPFQKLDIVSRRVR